MLAQPVQQRRGGTTVVECALVFSVLIVFLFGLIIAGLGIFRYQEVASLAREGARWASVRGTNYGATTGRAPATAADVYTNAIQPNLVILDPSQLSYSVTWNTDNRPGNTVTVRVSYQWIPEALLGGITLTSTSTMTVSY
jgi:Flp pilus assembly protein TadG